MTMDAAARAELDALRLRALRPVSRHRGTTR